MSGCRDIKKFNLIAELISLSLASVKIEKIIVNQNKGRKYEGIYPPLSLFVHAERGSLKSTFLRQVSKITGHQVMKKITAAGLVGSIDESGEGVVSPAWDHRKSVMLIDEFNVKGQNADETKQAMLDITEFGEYKKSIGRKVKKDMMLEDEDLFYKMKMGSISFKVNTALIMMTMRKHDFSIFHDALMTRCIPFKYEIEDIDTILNGGSELKIKNYRPPKIVKVNKPDWDKIVRFVKDMMTGKSDNGTMLRTMGIITKIYAIKGRHDTDLYERVINLKLNTKQVTMEYG